MELNKIEYVTFGKSIKLIYLNGLFDRNYLILKVFSILIVSIPYGKMLIPSHGKTWQNIKICVHYKKYYYYFNLIPFGINTYYKIFLLLNLNEVNKIIIT